MFTESFFKKAVAVVVIVDFARIQNYDDLREGAYARDKLNIQANAPTLLLSKSHVQKGAHFQELTVIAVLYIVVNTNTNTNT